MAPSPLLPGVAAIAPRRRRGVAALAQRPPDHHHVGAGRHRLGGRGHAGLIAPRPRRAGRTPGTTSSGPGPTAARTAATSCGEQTSPPAPGAHGEPRQPHHRLRPAGPARPMRAEGRVVEAGEHGHRQDAEPPRRRRARRPGPCRRRRRRGR